MGTELFLWIKKWIYFSHINDNIIPFCAPLWISKSYWISILVWFIMIHFNESRNYINLSYIYTYIYVLYICYIYVKGCPLWIMFMFMMELTMAPAHTPTPELAGQPGLAFSKAKWRLTLPTMIDITANINTWLLTIRKANWKCSTIFANGLRCLQVNASGEQRKSCWNCHWRFVDIVCAYGELGGTITSGFEVTCFTQLSQKKTPWATNFGMINTVRFWRWLFTENRSHSNIVDWM